MSATTATRASRRLWERARGGQALLAMVRAIPVRLRVRCDAARLPVYVSAFEAEHLDALAAWSDCRTGTLGRPIIETRCGGE